MRERCSTMGMEQRGSRFYYYEKRREGRRVISTYIGGGALAGVAAGMNAETKQEREQQRQQQRKLRYLGICYEKGHGVPQDVVEAYKFYKLAAEQNLENAVDNLKRIVTRMTTVEITEGERRVREFRSRKNLSK